MNLNIISGRMNEVAKLESARRSTKILINEIIFTFQPTSHSKQTCLSVARRYVIIPARRLICTGIQYVYHQTLMLLLA